MPDTPSERWRDVERLFERVRETPPEARAALIADACAGDATLQAEVESLLKYENLAAAFLTRPALEHVARSFPSLGGGALTGRQIHGYALQSLLGIGGMGEVYLARDLRLGRDVALKILPQSLARDAVYRQRFETEARSASVLNHPSIVTIYGVGEEGDVSYIAMERVHGRTLREIAGSADLAVPAVLDLAVQLADALAVAHDKGIVHRDLKPDNVMVTPDGLLKVLDFGIAKREGVDDAGPTLTGSGAAVTAETQAGTILGTVGYMSPEQADGRRAGPASDQFSFGTILYELLTGRRAFARGSRNATLDAIRQEQPTPIQSINANVSPALRRIVERCLAKDPADRYARTRDLASDLREVRERLAGGGLTRRQAIWLGAAASVAIATAGGAAWFWPRGPRVRSLALLPFDNVGGEPDIDPICAGLAANLIMRIDELPMIRVMPHSLVSNFPRSGKDARTFAREIGADSVFTGRIERREGGLAIAAALVETTSGKALWSNSYTRPIDNLQLIQDAIASEIVSDGIRLQLSDEDRNRLTRHETENPEAFQLVLRAAYLNEDDGPEVNQQRRELLVRATELGASHIADAVNGYAPPGDCWPHATRNVQEAKNRNGNLAEAHAATAGYEFFCNWDWEQAEAAWRQFMRFRGSSRLTLRAVRPVQQWALGHTTEAIRLIREVRTLDTLSPDFMIREATYLRHDGQLDAAAELYERANRVAPEKPRALLGLAETRHAQGRCDDAIAIFRQFAPEFPDAVGAVLARARGAEGYRAIERALAREELRGYEARIAEGGYVSAIDRARTQAQLGNASRAFSAIDEAFAARDPGLVFLKVDPRWAGLRDHPKFLAAIDRVGFPKT